MSSETRLARFLCNSVQFYNVFNTLENKLVKSGYIRQQDVMKHGSSTSFVNLRHYLREFPF